jgi:hypothetical protein
VTGLNAETGEVSGAEFTEASVVALLPGIYQLKRMRDDTAKRYETATKIVRAWLDAHPEDFLRDGETGISARLQARAGAQEIDAIRLAEVKPDLLLWLARQGCLKLDANGWKGMVGKAVEIDDARGFLLPGKGSVALLIDKEKD